MSGFEEAKHRRDRAGRFARKPRGEPASGLGLGAPDGDADVVAAQLAAVDFTPGSAARLAGHPCPLSRLVARDAGYDLDEPTRRSLSGDRQVAWLTGVLSGATLTRCPEAA